MAIFEYQPIHYKMQEFLLLIHGKGYKDESPSALKEHLKKYENWVDTLLKSNQYIKGQRLANSGNVLLNRETVLTDGPYLESKEIVGGYILIRAKDIEEATFLAKQCPLSEELPISIRPMYTNE